MAHHHSPRFELLDDQRVGVEDVHAGPCADLAGVTAVLVHRADRGDADGVADVLVLLTEPGSEVHHAGAVLGADEVGGQHVERGGRVGEVREQRRVVAADQVGAFQHADLGRAGELLLVRTQARFREDVALGCAVGVGLLHHRIVDVGTDGECEVAGKGPGGGGPGEDLLATVQLELHRQRRVLAVAIHVVHARLGVAERRLTAPAVRQHAEALVDQTFVPQGLERPHDALHVRRVERLVVVLEVDPARLAGDVTVPVVGETKHAGAAGVVELVDAELGDGRMTADTQLLLGHHLGGQPVAVPAESAVHLLPAHGAVAGHRVLHEAGEQVPVVRQAVGEGWAIVEDVLVGIATRLDRRFEGAVAVPEREHLALDGGERRLRLNSGVGHDGSCADCTGTSRPARGTTLLAGTRPGQPCLDHSTAPAMSGWTRPVLLGAATTGRDAVLPEARR